MKIYKASAMTDAHGALTKRKEQQINHKNVRKTGGFLSRI